MFVNLSPKPSVVYTDVSFNRRQTVDIWTQLHLQALRWSRRAVFLWRFLFFNFTNVISLLLCCFIKVTGALNKESLLIF